MLSQKLNGQDTLGFEKSMDASPGYAPTTGLTGASFHEDRIVLGRKFVLLEFEDTTPIDQCHSKSSRSRRICVYATQRVSPGVTKPHQEVKNR